MQVKIAFAGTNNTSYQQAEADLRRLANIAVSDKLVRRVCKQIGSERCAERDAEVAEYQAKPLMDRKSAPAGVTAPDVAVVGVDGGRLQIFERSDPEDPSAEPASATADGEASQPAADSPKENERGRHWREDKIGLVMAMTSDEHEADPCPDIPENFVNPFRILKLAREFKKHVPADAEATRPSSDPEAEGNAFTADAPEWKPPKVVRKHMVASRLSWDDFGPMVATAAWKGGFYAASRKAFIGDGATTNWSMWQSHFSSFTPILDFIHALTYVFASATTGREFTAGWECYVRWITWVWQGHVDGVIRELEERQLVLGEPSVEDSATHPRQVVKRAHDYLQNNQSRMKYAEYRTQGLPINSSYVESTVKQFNYRVKGTEKFWNEQGAEEILQLRADHLSDDEPLAAFWKRRETAGTGQNRYSTAA